MLKLGMVSSFTHIACAKEQRGSRRKLDAPRVQTGQSLSEYQVSDENSSVTRALQCFLNLFELQPIFAFSMHHSKRRHQFPTRSDIICCFQSFTDLFSELNDGEIENHYKMNSKNVGTWHGIIISPTQHVQES